MTGFSLSQVAIIEIEITYQGAVIESGSIKVRGSTPNQGTTTDATQLINVPTDHAYGLATQIFPSPQPNASKIRILS